MQMPACGSRSTDRGWWQSCGGWPAQPAACHQPECPRPSPLDLLNVHNYIHTHFISSTDLSTQCQFNGQFSHWKHQNRNRLCVPAVKRRLPAGWKSTLSTGNPWSMVVVDRSVRVSNSRTVWSYEPFTHNICMHVSGVGTFTTSSHICKYIFLL